MADGVSGCVPRIESLPTRPGVSVRGQARWTSGGSELGSSGKVKSNNKGAFTNANISVCMRKKDAKLVYLTESRWV